MVFGLNVAGEHKGAFILAGCNTLSMQRQLSLSDFVQNHKCDVYEWSNGRNGGKN